MRFKKIIMILCFSWISATTAWADWAISVPTKEECHESGWDSFGIEGGWPYILDGVDHIAWVSCSMGFACTWDQTAFNYCNVLANLYDCSGSLLEPDVPFSSGWAVIRGTGSIRSGGIGGHASNPACMVYAHQAPATYCRINFDWAPVKNPTANCNPWPAVPTPQPNKNLGRLRDLVCPPKGDLIDAFVGNPINVATGNKYEEILDLIVSTPGVPLEFRRSYNSQSSYDGLLGYGWTHNYDLFLQVFEPVPDVDPTRRIIIQDGDGRDLHFSEVGQSLSGQFAGESGVKDRLKKVGDYYFLRRKEGNLTYRFGSDGKLLQISDPNGNTLTMNYTGGVLTEVSNNFGKAISIHYDGNRIDYIQDPKGQSVSYQYQNGDLTKVIYPDGNSITYAYSNHNLTDKCDTTNNPCDVNNPHLIGHWDYTNGRVTTYYSHLKDGDPQERIDLSYEFLKTTLTRSTGQTTYTTAVIDGISVVTDIDGCSTCGGVNKHFDYSDRLDLTYVTVEDGSNYTTRYIYDDPTIPWEQMGDVLHKTEALGLSEARTTDYLPSHRTDDPFILNSSTETKPSVVLNCPQNKVITITYDPNGGCANLS